MSERKKMMVLLMIISCFSTTIGSRFYFYSNYKFEKVELNEYSIIDMGQLDEEIQEFVDSKKDTIGIHGKVIDGKTYAFINAGTLPSGSGIVIEEVLKNSFEYKVNYSVMKGEGSDSKEVQALICFNKEVRLAKN